jgi:hypothetical protein
LQGRCQARTNGESTISAPTGAPRARRRAAAVRAARAVPSFGATVMPGKTGYH